ncbi:DUF1906 domain-containing protein [Corynebacterium sp. ES2794-CONJ1]|uniref:DUF1906 domain-containing protein n=1 Tax=unclassified Corynebacterium TaxID=2624378 RepID=UPI0021681DAC|nr:MULTISPECIES: DUF1906 domain-containing protein [unclassified Corynebacterium]MCS4491590.1 DUF1906 domain-containing protein [Corynebacterium sp. ES2715-CONJ3]MCU9519090.1 DUF1906 domain-containing protein [Corynebacterium sp. ES2794-CONJ1]
MSFFNTRLVKALALSAAISIGFSPQAFALGPIQATVLDYSAGVPSAAAVKASGAAGAVRYVSRPRPDALWMLGKPVGLRETRDFAANGLSTASVYQFGKGPTADWRQGAYGAAIHAPQAIALHKAAGGPTGRPIYVAIDDNPTWAEYDQLIRPYLRAFQEALLLGGYSMGVYGNYNTIEWASRDGLGSFYWQHDWGSQGRIHPLTTIHQKAGQQRTVDGILVDVNNVYARDWGQWRPGDRGILLPQPPAPPRADLGHALAGLSSHIPGADRFPLPHGDQINQALQIVRLSS